MEFHGNRWKSMEFHDTSMEFHGMPWSSMEYPWSSMECHGVPWSIQYGGLLVYIFFVFILLNQWNSAKPPRMLGQFFFFLLFFVFSLTCYRVFFSFRSGISLITLLCYVLYVNFVIVYYLALIYYQFYGSFSVTTFVEVGFFLGGPDHQPCIPQHLVSSFVFIVFSLISFYSRFKVVFLYCNYYFFAFCRNLLFYGFLVKHLLIESLRLVFGIGPCPFSGVM